MVPSVYKMSAAEFEFRVGVLLWFRLVSMGCTVLGTHQQLQYVKCYVVVCKQ